MNPMKKRTFCPERSAKSICAESHKVAIVCIALVLGLVSTGYATVIGNFEGSMDGWNPAWEGSPVLAASTIGVTRGSGSLRVTTNGGYWCLVWYASIIPASMENKALTFDLTMVASEWSGSPSIKVGGKIALNSGGPSGWQEYGPSSGRPLSTTIINRDTNAPEDETWVPGDGDITKSYTVDISDYDVTGAGWFQIIFAIEGGDGVGHFYFDNVQIVDATPPAPPSPNPARLHVAGNRIKDPNGQTIVLRGIALMDLGFLQDWKGGAIPMINRITDETDDQGNSPGWFPKVVRIPVAPPDTVGGSWPHPFDPDNNDLNDLLRTVVDYCGQKGLYVIIDWHYVANTFDHIASTSEFWTYIAPKFANDTHVMFELFNEPNNPGATELERWLSVRDDMQTWIDIVRTYAPDTIILVGGPNYCQIIGPTAAYPVDGENIAYTTHIYPGHWLSSSKSWYTNHITTAATAHPLIMTEWGFQSSSSESLLQGTITNYGNPLKDFLENYRIGMTAWIASFDWGPPMFNTDWTLRVGEGEMGGFAKDWLYDANQALSEDVNSEEDDVDYTIIDMTITKCTVKAGATQRRDYFDASGTFASGLTGFAGIDEIEVRIVSDGNRIYTETIDTADARIVGNSLSYTGPKGAITSLRIDTDRNTFAIKAQNVDLTGLGCPLQLKFTLGTNRLSGQASEAIVNGSKIIPTSLMKTYKNTLVVTSAKDVNSSHTLWDSFTVRGNIAVEDINDTNLVDTDLVVTWGAQTFTVPAGNFTAKRGNRYTCRNAAASTAGLVNADFDFNKCTFSIKVRNITLDVASGEVDFGLSFNYGYNETVQLNMP